MAEFPWPLRPGSFRCPVPDHQDRSPSLSITQASDGRWLVYCHAGCTTARVLAAVGRSFEDLVPPGRAYRPRALPPPPAQDDSAAIIAEALAMERVQVRRVSPEVHRINDAIRIKRRLADSARQWVTKWGECEAAWTLAEIAAELDTEADDLEASLGA